MALVYEDTHPTSDKPLSFITMDGSYPCVMPYSESIGEPEGNQKYIATHGKFTIAGSFPTPEAAQNLLNKLQNDDTFMKSHVRPNTEKELNRFWPAFKNRFKYCGWKGRVVPKFKTEREYRSAVTFKDKNGLVHVIPGKISNIFDASKEVLAFVENKDVIHADNYSYIRDGELDHSAHEIKEKPFSEKLNTCDIHTYLNWFRQNIQARTDATVEERINNSFLFPNSQAQGQSTRPLFANLTAQNASATNTHTSKKIFAKL